MSERRRCPRCHAAMFEVGRGALSRTTRDEGADVKVCPRCGERETLYGYDPIKAPPLTDWPLSAKRLADEEFNLISGDQRSNMMVAAITPEDAQRMLGMTEDDLDSRATSTPDGRPSSHRSGERPLERAAGVVLGRPGARRMRAASRRKQQTLADMHGQIAAAVWPGTLVPKTLLDGCFRP
jgi:hypothetical protein